MSNQEVEMAGGPSKNEQTEKDAKKAAHVLKEISDGLKPLLDKARKSLTGLEASSAVSSARSAIAMLEDTALGAEKDIERILQQLPKSDKEASK